MGGLSLRRVDDFNFSLLSKWAWRWKMEKSALWAQLISAIYGEQGGFDFCPQANNFRSVWRSIIDNCQGRICMGLNVLSCIKRVVANGVSTKFWTDSWHDDLQPLHHLFPRLFALELEKECSIAERRVLRNDGWAFQWNWRTPPRGRSDDELHRLEELLRSLVLDHSKTDEWKWGLEANGLFSVKGLYRHLCFLRTPNIPRRPQFIWNSWVPIKVNVTVWRACLNRLPVVDNLIKRGIRCGISLCPLGCGVPESVEHSFCSCLNVGTLWKKVFAWWNLAFPANFGWDFIRRSLFVRSFSCLAEKAFHGVCCVTLWHLWTRRNRCIFDNASATNVLLEDDLFSRIQSKALCWLKYRSKAVSGQWSDWISNPKNLFP